MAKKVMCQLMGEKIEEAVCFDIHMVVDGLAPVRTIPKRAVQKEDFKEICKNCPNHRED